MPEPSTAAPALAQYDAERMRAMAADLTAHGLTTHLTDSRAGLDLTATLSPSGKREAELIIDEDGYAELRYWNPPGTPPAQVTATALRALHAVTGTPLPPTTPNQGSPLAPPRARRPAGGRVSSAHGRTWTAARRVTL